MSARTKKVSKSKTAQRRKKVVGPNATDPRFKGLKPWQPGQSGNPKGQSRKARRRAFLKEGLQDLLSLELPEEWRALLNTLELDGKLNVNIEEGSNVALSINTRLIVAALQGDFKAIEMILNSEPKVVEEDLDLDVNATQDGVADTLAGIAKRRGKKKRSSRVK